MLYYVLISVVIIAEIIIATEFIGQLIKWNKIFKETNIFLDEVKPKIKEISNTCLKISEQLKELAPYWVETIKQFFVNLAINHIKSTLLGMFIWGMRRALKKH